MGEPYRSGFDRADLADRISGYGLRIRSDLGPAELENMYLRHVDGSLLGRPHGFLGLVHAQVSREI
jgi:hypothetical protein